tara:strand:+ start:959 stop:1720 length:762 start_codon:yes stop_codon:yes gene_type:complete
MAKNIFSIHDNIITFIGDKGEQVSGTSEDCRFVGGKFISDGEGGGICVIKNTEFSNTDLTNNRNILGHANTVHTEALNNNIIGNYNTVDDVENTHTIGKFAHTTRHGEFNHAITTALGRSQRSVLMYQGTTTNNTETEVFLGGQNGKRFIVDETKECVIVLETYVLAKRTDSRSSAAMGKYQHATFRVTLGALDRIGINNKTNHNDGISGWSNDFVAVSDTPDYIKATVTGQASCTIDWTIIAMVSELKTNLV